MFSLSYEDLDRLINEISLGEKLAYAKLSSGEEQLVVLRHPTPWDTVIAERVQKQALQEAAELGLPTMAEMETTLRVKGIYTEADDAQIEVLQAKLSTQRAVLAKTTRVPARRDRLEGIIADIEGQINAIRLKKEQRMAFTRERKAAESRFLYLTWRGVRRVETGDLYWATFKEFEDEHDFAFRHHLFLEYVVFCHGLDQRTLRFISRSNLWRVRYVTALKTSDSLFGRPISQYTTDQLMLLYWSHYYQSIYDMLSSDRPPESIIEDDEALDAYMKGWHEERGRDAVAARAKNSSRGKVSAWDYNETLVMRSNEMYEDIEYSPTLAASAKAAGKASVDAAPLNPRKSGKGVFTRDG